MNYSVWNGSRGTYEVYDSTNLPIPRITSNSSGNHLGAVPQSVIKTLPPGAKYLGESERAVGEIVVTSMGFKEFALLIAAGIIARWIYERFLT